MVANDFPALDFGLGETADMLRNSVRDFATDEIASRAAAIDESNEFPSDLWRKMGDLGVLGITADEAYGGAGMGYIEHVVAMEEISRASACVGLSYGAHSNLAVNQIQINGSEAQKQRYLPKLISGEHVGALAMSEAGAGSDVVGMRLGAVRKGDRYILNGSKMWITNGPDADTLIIYAKTDPDAGHKGLSAFVVPREAEGFTVGPSEPLMGLRGSPVNELVLDGVAVPEDARLGEEGEGFRIESVRGFGPPIVDMVGNSLVLRVLDRISSLCARVWPTMFCYQFVVVATRLDDVDDILRRTLATGSPKTASDRNGSDS